MKRVTSWARPWPFGNWWNLRLAEPAEHELARF